MPKRQIVLALDVGTTKAAAMVVEIRTDGELAVLGLAATPVVGVRRGLIYDLERVAQAVRDAVNRANSMAGTNLTHAAVSVNGDHLQVTPGYSLVSIAGGTVGDDAIREALLESGRVELPKGNEVIQVIQRGVSVDGFRGVVDPVGMVANRLEMESLVVSGRSAVLKNLRRVLTLCGLTVSLYIPAPRASAEGALSEDERQVGVVLIDVGGGTTGVVVFQAGHLRHLSAVPLGGESITADLSAGLGVVVTQAERIKLENNLLMQPAEGMVEIRAVSGQASRLIPMAEVGDIVQARVEEWTRFVETQLSRVDWPKGPGAGVVMTGGGALLKGLSAHVEARWGWPVRLGIPVGFVGLSDLARNPGYATVAGVARIAAREGVDGSHSGWLQRILGPWVKNWR